MKQATWITLLASGMAFTAMAQERTPRQSKTPEEIAQMRTDQMTNTLELNGEQQKEVYALNLEKATKWKAEREERKAKMGELREERKAEQARLNNILTAEQQAKLQQERAERAEKMKNRYEARKGGKFRHGKGKKGPRNFQHKSGERPTKTEKVNPEQQD